MTQPVTFAAASRILLSVELDFAALYERHARDVYRFSLYLSRRDLDVCFWVAFFVTLWRMRARIMIVPGRKRP
jgi:hypothetical protein